MADKDKNEVRAHVRHGVYIPVDAAIGAALDRKVADASKAAGVQLDRQTVLTGVVRAALGIK